MPSFVIKMSYIDYVLYPVDAGFLVKVIHLGLRVFMLLRIVVFINMFGLQWYVVS